jgi:putative ABC transport system permease protein
VPEASTGVVAIGWVQLALASLFIIVTGAVTLALHLGVAKDLAVASLRTYLQLLALGLVLRWVFRSDTPLLVFAILAVMLVAATRIVLKRSPDAPRGLFGSTLLSLAITGITITFAVTGLVVGVEPWWRAQYVIPIGGMVIGNSMSGIALALERVFSDLESRADEVLALTALGATPWEAAQPSVRTALRRHRVHPGDDGRAGPRRHGPAHRRPVPDRRDAHGGDRRRAGIGHRRATLLPAPVHARRRLSGARTQGLKEGRGRRCLSVAIS